MPKFEVVIFRAKIDAKLRVQELEDLHREIREAPNIYQARDQVRLEWEAANPDAEGPLFVYGSSRPA